MPNPALENRIVSWLESERAAYAMAAGELGVPLSINARENHFEQIDDAGYQATQREVQVSPLAIPAVGGWLSVMFEQGRGATEGVRALAEECVRAFGAACSVWSLRPPPVEDPAASSRHLLEQVRNDYLSSLVSLGTPDEGLARRLAAALVALFESQDLVFVTGLPLAGIRGSADRIEAGNAVLRRLTHQELGDLLNMGVGLERARRPGALQPPGGPQLGAERWMLEVRSPCSKTEQPQPGVAARRVVLALQLLGFELTGVGTATTWTEPGPSSWSGSQRFRLPHWGLDPNRLVVCTPEVLERATRIACRIPEEAFRSPTSRIAVSLHRFLLGASEDSSSETLIDHVIVLESLFLDDSREELSFRFRLFGAHFLEEDPAQRRATFDQLKSLYARRSILVHGSAPRRAERDRNALLEEARTARRLAARALVKSLEDGPPNHQQLLAAALGAQTAIEEPPV